MAPVVAESHLAAQGEIPLGALAGLLEVSLGSVQEAVRAAPWDL